MSSKPSRRATPHRLCPRPLTSSTLDTPTILIPTLNTLITKNMMTMSTRENRTIATRESTSMPLQRAVASPSGLGNPTQLRVPLPPPTPPRNLTILTRVILRTPWEERAQVVKFTVTSWTTTMKITTTSLLDCTSSRSRPNTTSRLSTSMNQLAITRSSNLGVGWLTMGKTLVELKRAKARANKVLR